MHDALIWLYLLNAILLINHEIDSAYWKEWKLFSLPGGINGFLLIHFLLLFIVLYGLILIVENSFWGLVLSLFLCFGGIFAFLIHFYFLRQGRSEFDSPLSKIILIAAKALQHFQIMKSLRCPRPRFPLNAPSLNPTRRRK